MKHVKKNRFTQKQLCAMILLAAFTVLLAVAIILGVIYKNRDDEEKKQELPEIIEGEAYYNNYAVAYPVMKQSDIMYVEISGANGSYGIYRPEKGKALELYYIDSNGDTQIYYPPIAVLDPTFSYDSLYALEKDDGFGAVPKLTYLCSALTYPYFRERIELSSDAAEREKQLDAYGFGEGETTRIFFTYNVVKTDENGNAVKDENGKAVTEEKTHTVTLGKKDITDNGYYFMLDGRNYVYASESTYYDYAVAGFSSLVNSTLIAAGLPTDRGFGPYLTQGYYQWLSEKHEQMGEKIPEDSRVVVYADTIDVPSGDGDDKYPDGYIHSGYKQVVLDLAEYKKKGSGYVHALNAILGKEIGQYGDNSGMNNIVFSILFSSTGENKISFDDTKTQSYLYTVKAIDAVLTDSGERFDEGFAVGNNTLIKIKYDVTVGEKTKSSAAVLDISSDLVPQEAREALSASSVGTLPSPVSFTVNYTEENAHSNQGEYIVSEILSIQDKNGKTQSKVASDSVVSYKYVFIIDGEIVEEAIRKIDLSKLEDDEDKKIAKAITGSKKGTNLGIKVDEYTSYFEIMSLFKTFKISRVEYFVTDELVAAFKFQNNSDRDPYYGESLYENLMTNEYSLYGLNYTSCQGIVKFLGGISADGSSATANGLSGMETVAVGITPEVMDKYGLYAHKIYFELPRGIEGYVPENGEELEEDSIDDYFFYDTLGFTLYVSHENPEDGTRYIASDMYDVVVKIDGENFFFLDETFESFFARRSIMLMDIEHIESMTVRFGFEDVKGKYKFELGKNSDDGVTVKVTPEGDCTPTELTKYMEQNGFSYLSLEELFETKYPNDPEKQQFAPDSVGTTYFKEVLRSIYFVEYEGALTDEEVASATLGKCLFRIELKIKSSAYKYAYEFYAVDASRVLVTIHKENSKGETVLGPVADFYISTFAFKKIAKNGFLDLLNAVKVNPEVGYPDENLS